MHACKHVQKGFTTYSSLIYDNFTIWYFLMSPILLCFLFRATFPAALLRLLTFFLHAFLTSLYLYIDFMIHFLPNLTNLNIYGCRRKCFTCLFILNKCADLLFLEKDLSKNTNVPFLLRFLRFAQEQTPLEIQLKPCNALNLEKTIWKIVHSRGGAFLSFGFRHKNGGRKEEMELSITTRRHRREVTAGPLMGLPLYDSCVTLKSECECV